MSTAHARRRRLFHGRCAPGKWLADLPALARLRLQALGITQVYGNDGSAGLVHRGQCVTVLFAPARPRQRPASAAGIWLPASG